MRTANEETTEDVVRGGFYHNDAKLGILQGFEKVFDIEFFIFGLM